MPYDKWQARRNGDGNSGSASATGGSATDMDRLGESSRSAQRSRRSPSVGRDGEHAGPPNKARRLDDRAERRYDAAADSSSVQSNSSSALPTSRRTDSARDSAMPTFTIRGIAATQGGSSPPAPTAKGTDDRSRRARSPDLLDRLARRKDESNGSGRQRPDPSLRSRLDGEASRSDGHNIQRRGATKLAPRGQYDDTGRRVDDVSSSADGRDRQRGSRARDDVPTSPRKRDAASRRYRERSNSPVRERERPRFRGAEEQDTSDREDRVSRVERTRPFQRSPSPTSAAASRTGRERSRDRYDRYERRRSPPRASETYTTEDRNASSASTSRSARWGPRARLDEQEQSARMAARQQQADSGRRRRSPSPAWSDASNRSRRRDPDQASSQRFVRDQERDADRDRLRERPARWRINKDDDGNDSMRRRRERDEDADVPANDDRPRRDPRHAGAGRERRRSPDDRRPRTPPRSGRIEDGGDRGHVLSRKATFDGKQPPTGPRGQDGEAQQRSVRGGGWQTVRPGSRSDRSPAKASSGDTATTSRNGRDISKAGEEDNARRGAKSSVPVAALEAAPSEPARAEPGEAYESIHQVGEGTYGQVFKARSERTGALVALKKIRMDAEKDGFPVTAMREIKLLQALRHENIVRLHEMMVTRGSIYMVFEYMEHDLNGILAHPQVQFSDAHLKSLASQLFSGLDYLHRKAVLHRDLKGSNLLLNNQGGLKIADFGLARFFAKRRSGDYTNRVVTLWYRPLELLFGATQYGSEVDMWGAGCIFLELFVKKPVFTRQTELDQVYAITDVLGPVTKANWPDVEQLAWYEMVKPITPAEGADTGKDYVAEAFSNELPTSALEVARGLLTYDPKKRWTAKQALTSDYFQQAPKAERPAGLLSALEGEWHEYESRRAKKKASAHGATDRIGADAGGVATSSNHASSSSAPREAGVRDPQTAAAI